MWRSLTQMIDSALLTTDDKPRLECAILGVKLLNTEKCAFGIIE